MNRHIFDQLVKSTSQNEELADRTSQLWFVC
jgi:hypothetical protein